MSQPLPLRANLEWLKKACKERLAALRAHDPHATLSDAQLTVAREYGFPSWRKLKAHVEALREKLDEVVPADLPPPSAGAAVPPNDPDLAQLLAAIRDGQTQAVADLLKLRPALAGAHGPGGETPLHLAAQHNDPQLGVLLLGYRADPEARFGQSGHTVLSWAVTCNATEFARVLVKLGTKPDLFCAAGMGSLEHVRACFDEAGQLVPGASRTGSSRFSEGRRLPCPPETPQEQISDALCAACRNAHVDVVRFLLNKQPDLTFRAYLGATPLHWAYFGGSREVIDLLLAAGADAAARDDCLHSTPRAFGISIAANWGFDFLVRKRLSEDPTLVNVTDGQTSPLHGAARGGHAEVTRLLLAAGADPLMRNHDGKTPQEVAADGGHATVAQMLQQAAAAGDQGGC